MRRGIHRLVRPDASLPSALLVILSLLPVLSLGCRRGAGRPPVDTIQQAFKDDTLTAQQSRGRQLFAERCATCHGLAGRGDGQNAYNLQPSPPDFPQSLPALSVPDRRRVIVEGTAALGRSPLCPPRGRALDDDAVDDLLAYLEVMARQPPEEEEPPGPARRHRRRR